MGKHEKKKKKGGAVAGVGALLIAALLAFDPFNFGIGFGDGFGIGLPTSGETQGDGDEQGGQENQDVSVTPEATKEPDPTEAPEETPDPTPTEGAGEVTLKEVSVEVSTNKVLYNGAEAESVQKLAEQLKAEYATELANVIVKVNLKDAVYDTVEAIKLALEGAGIKYEITE